MTNTHKNSTKYIPKVGDSVSAWRREKSQTGPNTIAGPVASVSNNACKIVFNGPDGALIEWDLLYSEWSFMFLHYSSEATDEAISEREQTIMLKYNKG